MPLDLTRIPRTIRLIRADASLAGVPCGFPVLVLLDQSALPKEEHYLFITDWREVIDAIKQLKVRGAPAIGIAGAAAVVLRSAEYIYASHDDLRQSAVDFDRVFIIDEEAFDPELYATGLEYAASMIKAARPTAVSLKRDVDACVAVMRDQLEQGRNPQAVEGALFDFVCDLIERDEAANRAMGKAGAALLPDDCTVLTHCNAGSLATAFFGTALGVVYAGAECGKVRRVFVDETRPVCQGARLSAWELSRAGVPATVICDNMAATVMAQGLVDAVVVGADRIAANGDVANKVGTLGVAVCAHHFGIPVYVVAPSSTIDQETACGADIPIEHRDPSEVMENPIEGVEVYNPAFDVTPAALVTAIVTERGVFAPAEVAASLAD